MSAAVKRHMQKEAKLPVKALKKHEKTESKKVHAVEKKIAPALYKKEQKKLGKK